MDMTIGGVFERNAIALEGQSSWLDPILSAFENPIALGLLLVVTLVASWLNTRNWRHTLAGCALIASSVALPALGKLINFPALFFFLLPVSALILFQGIYWATSQSERLQWMTRDLSVDNKRDLKQGQLMVLGGFLIMWAVTAALSSWTSSELTNLMAPYDPSPSQWIAVIAGIGGLIVGFSLVVLGSLNMMRGLWAVTRRKAHAVTKPQ